MPKEIVNSDSIRVCRGRKGDVKRRTLLSLSLGKHCRVRENRGASLQAEINKRTTGQAESFEKVAS